MLSFSLGTIEFYALSDHTTGGSGSIEALGDICDCPATTTLSQVLLSDASFSNSELRLCERAKYLAHAKLSTGQGLIDESDRVWQSFTGVSNKLEGLSEGTPAQYTVDVHSVFSTLMMDRRSPIAVQRPSFQCTLALASAALLLVLEGVQSFLPPLSGLPGPAMARLSGAYSCGIDSSHDTNPALAPLRHRRNSLRPTRRSSSPTQLSCSASAMEVVVVGSCNTDLVVYTPRLPQPGERSFPGLISVREFRSVSSPPTSSCCGAFTPGDESMWNMIRTPFVHDASPLISGETITGSRSEMLYGGKGANQVRSTINLPDCTNRHT